ncbi:TolC family protein [Mucilaginibacter sp. UR6-11]|uniref:TolC family protein n=1 Tax=Mucilaginibacter sp. UR6-11 TaxID=1435644 RepID=UPI001E64EE88|nr:TolC family protein [Mucilaginibacter sp. UR6-11]MCC8426402.1 TolC family protein [Mucilaginibacter sp. UR6-11]
MKVPRLNRIFARMLAGWMAMMIFPGRQSAGAQEVRPLTIAEAYRLARENYPLIRQRDLIARSGSYSVTNAARGYLPVVSVNGQATYQSTVTSFPFSIPIPGFSVPKYSRDQYKAYAELDQVVYDGGLISNQRQTARANEEIQQQNLEVNIYALYDRVNQLYFGALLIAEQLNQNNLLKKDVQNGIDKAKAMVAGGTAYRSSVDELSAQLLQAEQARISLRALQKAYLGMLSLLINVPLDEHSVLERPVQPVLSDDINRPEIRYYEVQKKMDELQEGLLKVQLRPKLGFFVQEGYGRPGLNMLSNAFSWYYIGGLRLSWNLGGWYTFKNQKELLKIHRETLDIQKETFLFNTALTQEQQLADIGKYRELFRTDQAIIALRESVKKAAAAQLENGVLSAHDYLSQVNAEDLARQNQILHEIQLLQEAYSYQNTTGTLQTNP